MAEAARQIKGTRPEGAVTETDASKRVREMFTQIAPRYDLLNHLLSLQLDRLWRARTARLLYAVLDRPDALVLDLCCGTGDLAFALARAGKARIVGADFAHPMLVRAREKSAAMAPPANQRAAPLMPFFEADALWLPFADASFDLVTSAFGFRNLANYEAGLREIQRVLKPGGTIAILEFTEPYSYLPNSVARFFRPAELAALMSAVGYHSVAYRVWTLGSVAFHTGLRAKQFVAPGSSALS